MKTPPNPFQTHPQPHIPFTLADTSANSDAAAAKKDPVLRQARAAEYIAMYLDRIEVHLGRIADACEQGSVNAHLVAELKGLAHLLGGMDRRR
jgi:hypothetical protein